MGPLAIQPEHPMTTVEATRAPGVAGGFSRALARVAGETGRELDAGDRPSEEGRRAAEQLLSTAFIMPVLRQVREMNNAPAPWGPTEAEKQFGPLLDQRMADDLVRAGNWKIVERLARDLSRLGPETPNREVRDGVDRIA